MSHKPWWRPRIRRVRTPKPRVATSRSRSILFEASNQLTNLRRVLVNTIALDEPFDQPRRRFLGSAAMTVAAAQFGMMSIASTLSSKAKAAPVPPVKRGTHTSFGRLKQVDAGLLNVGYAEAGPADGPAVL